MITMLRRRVACNIWLLPWRPRSQHDLAAKSSLAQNFVIWSRILQLLLTNYFSVSNTYSGSITRFRPALVISDIVHVLIYYVHEQLYFRQFPTVEEVLLGARHMVAMQLSHDPLVRQCVRQSFFERARLHVTPTKKGLKVKNCIFYLFVAYYC